MDKITVKAKKIDNRNITPFDNFQSGFDMIPLLPVSISALPLSVAFKLFLFFSPYSQ